MTEISDNNNNKSNEKALRETQTLRARHRVHDGCSKAGPKFSPRRRPFPGRAGPPKIISWRWSSALTDPVWWRSMHAISSYRGNRHRPLARPPARPPQTHKHTDRTDYNTLRR